MEKNRRADWILRFVKGIFIGSGFILPGVSGGALAAVFGIYERIISFLSNIFKDFKENVRFFLPVGLGMFAGMFLFSFVVSYMLGNAETYTLWFFIGCILGMLPALFKQSAKKGRKPWHFLLVALVCAVSFALLKALETIVAVDMPHNMLTWLMAGGIIGLGVIVPGLSPSNLLVYMDLYKPMADGIKGLDLMVVLPLAVGALACVLLLSKLMQYIFSKAYAVLYHCILGIVFASTLIIVPFQYNYLSIGGLWSLLACAAGAALAFSMSKLEDKYKPEQ
jgi:putative membrane protein